MAAIKPHLEQEDEASPVEKAHDAQPGRSRRKGRVKAAPTAAEVINKTHAGLVGIAWTRQMIEQALIGRSVTLGFVKNKAVLTVDPPLPAGVPAWNAIAPAGRRRARFLSWTSKMGAPSWSLPAGALILGGACPGADAGQSVVAAKEADARVILRVLGEDVRLDDAVCQRCYATGGNYMYASNQLAQLLRLHWQKHALADGTFVSTMVEVISRANFEINGRAKRERDDDGDDAGDEGPSYKIHPEPPQFQQHRFFRIHDSGDFTSKYAVAAWKQVANALPHIVFWAPTRIWATPWGIKVVNEINNPPRNLIIRPSAYHVNEHAPVLLGPGWAGGTVVYHKTRKHEAAGVDWDWDCQTYATTQKNHTCRVATPPVIHGNTIGLGAKDSGCRACWLHPELRINYTEH